MHLCDQQKAGFPAGKGHPVFCSARLRCPFLLWKKIPCFVFVLSVEEESPQPVNAKSTEMARDAAITVFNFIEFVLSVLFFMILNLL